MAIAIPSPLPDASAVVSGKVSLTAQTLGAGPKTIAQVVTPIVNNTNGTGATDVCVKLGTSVADGSVNTTAKLVSVRTGVAGTEVEKLSVLKSGALTTASTIGMTSDPSAPLSAAGEVKLRSNSGAIQASQNGGAYANLGGVDVTLTAIGSTPNASGASLTGQALTLQPASLLYGGVVSNTTQTFAGQKSFNDTFTLATTGLTSQAGLDTSTAPGAVTVDAPNGVSAIASGATTVVITNSLCTTSSKVAIEWYGDHGAARSWVVRANGSFTVTLSSAASANTSFGWTVSGITSSMLNGLIHSWSLNGNSTDIFVTGNGTDTAVTYVAGKLGQCASFNGTTSAIVTAALSKPLTWTMSMWINPPPPAPTGNQVAWAIGGSVAGQCAFLYRTSNTNTYTLSSNAANGVALTITPSIWTHVAITYDGTNSRCYRDGVLSGPVAVAIAASTGVTCLGFFQGFTLPFNGLLDDTHMWNRALSAAEVTNLYNGSVGRYYPFN